MKNNETQQQQALQPCADTKQSENSTIAENIITPAMLQSLKVLKNIADKDFRTIENLVSIGGLQENDGQILKNEVLKKMFDTIKKTATSPIYKENQQSADGNSDNMANFDGHSAHENENIPADSNQTTSFDTTTPSKFAPQNTAEIPSEQEILGKSYPTAQIIDFLTQNKNNLPPEKLAELVKTIETNAVQDYINKMNLSEKQQQQNNQAKQKLTSSVTNGKAPLGELNKIFTRETLKKLPPEEFKRYENIIAKQIEMGLLK